MDQSVHTNLNNAEELTMTLRLTGFLNANHYAVFNGKRGQTHSHSWQLQLEVEIPVGGKELVRFEDLERILIQALKPYQRTVLNELDPFDKYQPFTENIAAHFFNYLSDLFAEKDSRLTKLVAWENPTKGVEIKQRLPYHLLSGQVSEVPETASPIPTPVLAASDGVLPLFGVSNEAVNQIAAANDQTENDATDGTGESENTKDELLTNKDDDFKIHLGSMTPGKALKSETAMVEPSLDDTRPLPKISWWKWAIIISIIAGVAVAAYYPLLFAPDYKVYPWGSDTWGHLYKAKLLAEQITQGNYFPQFSADWYNGNQPFRYWAPLPYYVVAGLYYLTSNIFVAGNYYIFLCALIGALGWLAWRKRIPLGICILLAVIWLIWPDNVRVALAEGNFPRVLATALLPWLVACYLNTLAKRRAWGSVIAVIVLIHLTILCHAMIGAVYCVALFLFTVFYWLFGGGSLKAAGRGVTVLVLGILTSAWWLLPALSGGLVGMGSEAAAGGIQYIPFSRAFNPTLVFTNRENYYLGIALIPLILYMVVNWKRKPTWARASFIVGILLTLISFPSFSWLHKLMPLYSILWPLRFRSIAGLMLLASAAVNKGVATESSKSKVIMQSITAALLLLVIIDSCYVDMQLISTREIPYEIADKVGKIEHQTGWRVATLDRSTLGSAPSYFISEKAQREQVFGWAWQGAATASNIMLLNTALEYKLYPFVIKQLCFLGATDIISNPHGVKSPKVLSELLMQYGYKYSDNTGTSLNYWHGWSKPYLVAAKPEGLAIGKFASMYSLQYPSLQIGESIKIDDYTLEGLSSYPVLILAGANWNSQTKAERLVIDYARQGGRVIVDLNGFPTDVFSKQPKFLNVYGQTVSLRGAMKAESKQGETKEWLPYDSSSSPWSTLVPLPVDEAEWTFNYMNSPGTLFGYKEISGVKIGFVGGNPVYHAFLTGDLVARQKLGEWLGLSEEYLPPKVYPVQDYQVEKDGYTLVYNLSEREKVVVPVAKLDGMQAYVDGKHYAIKNYENLVSLELPAGQHTLMLRVEPTPVYKYGAMVSLTTVLVILLISPVTGLVQRRKGLTKPLRKEENV